MKTVLDGLEDILIRTGKYSSKKELFDDALRALLRTKPEIRREVAIDLYKNGEISLSRGAEICGVNIEDFKEMLKERGIKIKEAKTSTEEEFVNLVQLEIKTDKERKIICGTLSANKQPRIVKIDDYYVEIIPAGEMVVIQNWDRPGIIGNLGMLMGKQNINIASMTFGRQAPGGKAITVLNVDSTISPTVLEKIKKTENVLGVKVIKI